MAVARVVQFLRDQVAHPDLETATDAQLLQRFLAAREETAFAALVRRHGKMVWGVCRRMLGHEQDAEDAFQATFLVLVRIASAIRPASQLGNWLYGVAHHIAVKARAMNARRTGREKLSPVPVQNAEAKPDLWSNLQPLLDRELSLLPEKYRTLLVLCDLEGRTRKEVAAQLGIPEGTVAGRLARARALLARRLERHGLTASGATLAAVLAQSADGAPAPVVASTVKLASVVAAGGSLSPRVAGLAEGVVKAMLLSKLKTGLIAIVVVLGLGAASVSLGTFAQEGRSPSQETREQANANAVALPEKLAQADRERLLGTWRVVNSDVFRVGETWTFREDRVLFRPDEKIDRYYTLDPTKKPKQIDIVLMPQPDGQPLASAQGIYEFRGKELWLRTNNFEPKLPRPQTFDKKKEANTTVLVLKRVFTPAEVVRMKLEGEVCVEFTVAEARLPGPPQLVPSEPRIVLHPREAPGKGARFNVELSGAAYTRAVVDRFGGNFGQLRDKVVRVTGTVEKIPIAGETLYRMYVAAPKALEIVTPNHSPKVRPGEAKGSAPGRAENQELAELAGDWKLLSSVIGGKKTDATEGFSIKGDTLTGKVLTATLKIDPLKEPKQIDIFVASGQAKGQWLRGIYKREGNFLTICLPLGAAQRPSQFTSPPGSQTSLAVYRRVVPQPNRESKVEDYLTRDGKLKAALTLRKDTVGLAPVGSPKGEVWVIEPTGDWTSQVGRKKGKLSARQLAALAQHLATQDFNSLPQVQGYKQAAIDEIHQRVIIGFGDRLATFNIEMGKSPIDYLPKAGDPNAGAWSRFVALELALADILHAAELKERKKE